MSALCQKRTNATQQNFLFDHLVGAGGSMGGTSRPSNFAVCRLITTSNLVDNKQLTAQMRETHDLCDEGRDVATASLLEVWIDEAERRTLFLFEASRRAKLGAARLHCPQGRGGTPCE